MKQILSSAISLLLLFFGSFAQVTESFDIATFQSPKGWKKQATQSSIQMSTAEGEAFCLITLFKSLPALGAASQNFQASWDTIVKEAATVSSAPQMQPADNRDGWEVLSGFAPFAKDGTKGAAVFVTASGFGRMVNILILTNTQAYEKHIATFLDSLNLKKPAVLTEPQTTAVPNGSEPTLSNNYWKMGGVRQGMLGQAGLSTATFSKTYNFLSDGTYKFFRVDMQLAAPKYYLENEEGTYKVTGNILTIIPRKASFSQHRLNKEDPPIKAGNLPLSTAQYRFEFWMYDGNWRLLLSQVDGNETKRDGTFSFYRNGEVQRTYQFNMVDSNGRLIQ